MSGSIVTLTDGDDTWPGGSDTNSGNDSVLGLGGNDSIDGGADNDTILGEAGRDTITGGEGNDSLQGGLGNDSLIGGAGTDWASYASATGAVTVNLGAGTSSGADGNDSVTGIENVLGGNGADILTGDNFANVLDGGAGDDRLYGGDGNDTLIGGAGTTDYVDYGLLTQSVTVDLGIGRATLAGGTGEQSLSDLEHVVGGSADDSILGDSVNNNFYDRLGSDTYDGAGGAFDAIYYSGLSASTSSITVDVAAGRATTSGFGNDSFTNIEAIYGSAGNDSILGSGGNDYARGEGGNDTIDGGAGTADRASYSDLAATQSVTVNLVLRGATVSGGFGNDSLINIERVLGGAGNDSILGDGNANYFWGNGGGDTLSGAAGNDTFEGGAGNDFASYATANDTVRATLSDNETTGGVAEGVDGSDQLFGIEGLIGGNSSDTLSGNSAVNTLMGGDGSDSLVGGGGNDLLDYGAGTDEFVFRSGFHTDDLTLMGGAGDNDYLNLGSGWISGPVTNNDWINFQRLDTVNNDTIVMYTQGWDSIVCFAEGTRIVTPSGEDAVENLRAGDMVLAMRDGQAGFEPLRWVGFMDVAVPRNAAMAAKTAPILIKAGAIAPGMPARDLRVSPDHAMEVDGHLIPAKHLVNGSSIIQEVWCKRVRYFHLELEAHGLLLSEGTWSESYLDDGNRDAFNNTAMTGLFLDFEAGRSQGQYDQLACLPVLRQGLKLDEIHGRLALRAEAMVQPVKAQRKA